MQRKKELKGKDKYSGVYLNDDLTPMRAKLLKYVKGLDVVDQAWTIDGKIYMKWVIRRRLLKGLSSSRLRMSFSTGWASGLGPRTSCPWAWVTSSTVQRSSGAPRGD
jgi:hypothetical protein